MRSRKKSSQNGQVLRPGSSEAHTALVNEILLEVGSSGKGIFWRQENGMARNYRTLEPFKYGMPGLPDVCGFNCFGFFVGFEAKTGNSVQSTIQRAFNDAALKMNAFYFVAHSRAEAREYFFRSLEISQKRMVLP